MNKITETTTFSSESPAIAMSTCLTKPWLASITQSKEFQLHDTRNGSLMMSYPFDDDPLCLSLHPAGHSVLVGFHDRLSQYDITATSLELFQNIPARVCRQVSYCSGGHMFASGNGTSINIYNAWTLELKATLKAHSGRINSLSWSQDDTCLVSAGSEGAVYNWSMDTMKRESELVIRGSNCISAVFGTDCATIYSISSDGFFRQIKDSTLVSERKLPGQLVGMTILSSGNNVALLFQSGGVHVLSVDDPADTHSLIKDRGVTSAFIASKNDSLIFVGSLLGNIEQLTFGDSEDGQDTEYTCQEVLIKASELIEIKSTVQDYLGQLEEVKISNEYQMRLHETECDEKMRTAVQSFEKTIANLKLKNQQTAAVNENLKLTHRKVHADSLVRQQKEFVHADDRLGAKLLAAMERNETHDALNQKKQADYETLHDQRSQQINQSSQVMMQDYELRFNTRSDELASLQADKDMQAREIKEMISQQEQDIDAESIHYRKQYQESLNSAVNNNARIKGENAIMKKKFLILEREIREKQAEVKLVAIEHQKYQDIIKSMEKEISMHQKEVRDRDDFIQEKEKRVFEFKTANQDLEKFRFVLEYSIKYLRGQVDPMDAQVDKQTDRVSEKNIDLETFFNSNIELEKFIDEYRVRVTATKKQVEIAALKTKQLNITIDSFRRDMDKVMTQFQSHPRVLEKSFAELHKKHCGGDEQVAATLAAEHQVAQEWFRQKKTLSTVHESLKYRNKMADAQCFASKSQRLKANQSEIDELSVLRKIISANERDGRRSGGLAK